MSDKTLFVSDLDGTLLDNNCKVSEETAAVLNHLIETHNIMFTVATARTPATVMPLLEKVNVKIPMVVMTGAALWNGFTGSYSNLNPISDEVLDSILEIARSQGFNPFVYTMTGNSLSVYHSEVLSPVEAEFVKERDRSPYKKFHFTDAHPSGAPLLIFATCEYPRLKAAYERIMSLVECEAVCYHDIYNIGNADGLDSVQSISDLLRRMSECGYTVDNVPWARIEILDDARGVPHVVLADDDARALSEALRGVQRDVPTASDAGAQPWEGARWRWHISLSHDGPVASAVAILVVRR